MPIFRKEEDKGPAGHANLLTTFFVDFMVRLIIWKRDVNQLIIGTSKSIQNMKLLIILLYLLSPFKRTSSK